jgi:hypothetical protein
MRIAAIVFVTLLAGCAAQAAGPPASVDLNALVRAHPLYGTLAQYDRQIAALRATLRVPEFARKDRAFANARRGVTATLTDTAARTQRIAALPTPDVRSLQPGAGIAAPSESSVRADMQQTYSTQAAQLHADARAAMERYRTQLLAQQNAAYANYVRAMHERVQQAYVSREQQLYEKESTLALDLAKGDMGKRLAIRTKLQTLILTPEQRHTLQAQMDAIQAHEDAIVARQHRRDQAALAAFLKPLQAKADADIGRMRTDLQKRTDANLAARERVLAAQNAAGGRLDLGRAAAAPSGHANMQAQLSALLSTPAADPNAFLAARDDLAKRFSDLQTADNEATRSTQDEIATLERRRSQLYSDIVSQIMRDARAVARTRGLSRVYTAPQAPAGSTDITQTVRADFAALAR